MSVGVCILLVVVAICTAVVLCIYLCLCGETGKKPFEDPRYADRIEALEKKVEELMKK